MASLLAPVALDEANGDDYARDDDDYADEPGRGSPSADSGKLQKWKQEKLIRSIARLDKPIASHKKIKRSEPAKTIGDQDVSFAAQKSLSVSALLGKSDSSGSEKGNKKRIDGKKESKALLEPMRKIDAVKLKRSVAYKEVSKDLEKWDPIVKANRVAEGVSFPLEQNNLQIQTASEYVQRYKKKTPLEQEIVDLLNESRSNFTKATILTEAEKEALSAMSVKEAEFRRQELQKTRALLSYKEQKSRWQSKIKSKGYHRHLRRAKRKIDEKAFEELQKTDPDAAVDKLEGLDKERIKERLTLKHRNMGKWARHTATLAKNNKDARESLQEQLRLSRSLAEKLRPIEDSDEDEDAFESVNPDIARIDEAFEAEAKFNPWMSSAAAESNWEEVKESPMDKVFENLELKQQRKEKEAKKPAKKVKQQKKPLANRSRPTRRQSPDSDGEIEEETTELVDGGEMIVDNLNTVQSGAPTGVSQQHQKHSIPDTDVDPSNVLIASRTKIHRTTIPGGIDEMEEEQDHDEEQRGMVAEAFADDDIMEDFSRDKQKAVEKEKPKDIDLTLPGWGDWAGAGIGANQFKIKQFTLRAPKSKARKDRFLPGVIISERHDEKIVPHQIRELPFPFTTVAQLHSTIRAPIGKTWNTESAFDEMTKPKYTTKMGAIIRPLNPKVVLRKDKRKAGESFDEEGTTALDKSQMEFAGRIKPVTTDSATITKRRKN